MFKERLKTFLLLFLVFISVFLTRGIWIKVPYELLPYFHKEEAISANYLFSDMIKPDKYLVNFKEKNHTIFYSDNHNLWASSRFALADILSSSNIQTETLTIEEFLKCQNSKSIVFYFPQKISTYILARSLEIAKPNGLTEKIPDIDKIHIYLGKGQPYIILAGGDQYLKVTGSGLDLKDVGDRMKLLGERDYSLYYPITDTLNINSDIYITYRISEDLPITYVENELNIDDVEEIKDLAGIFFDKNIDYIREIVENNGSRLYIYKQKVLKINTDGLLEYFNPLGKAIKNRNLYTSLITASEFLSSHLGVPKDLYLSKIEEIESEANLGYRLSFNYRIKDLPVFLGKDITEDFIQIDVFNDHIRSYKRFIRKDINTSTPGRTLNREILSGFDIINKNYEILENGYIQDRAISIEDMDRDILRDEVLSSIKDISLAYLDPCLKKSEERLIGVWLLEIENRIYAFNLYNGDLILTKNNL